ncbi:heme-degrading domain-containing protein [Amycolatopsis sp. CA-128772]|uniref:heme-degrading domain-containing protein n=1 Tax=Amycolatopsis sp. CA-128772 TaxID=2073159 RepID=UPI000CD20BA3|nr:heme-degrading domain-containing protein [Amycolatopsis sp. CA-128772]
MTEAERLAQLFEQEERLQFTKFDNETALALGQQMLDDAADRGLALTISIRRNGQRLFHAALPGTSADNDGWIDRKSRVVDRYGHSSFLIGTQFRANGGSFEQHSRLDLGQYAAHGGVFPVLVRGVGPVGTVGVSGLPQAEDHAFVVEQLERFLDA